MSPDDKLIEKLRRRPPTVEFSDIEKLLGDFGWERKRQRGSHVSFAKPGNPTITVPMIRGRKVKGVYLDRIFQLLGIED
jgi:predicted RNA binding protein YcfA (HicA-like mRNA interferase family)